MTGLDLTTCDACLRRALLVAFLAPRIAGLLDRPRARVAGLLGLPNEDLIAAAAGTAGDDAERYVDGFEPDEERVRIGQTGTSAVCLHSTAYPEALHDLDDPPAVLFVSGRTQTLARLADEPTVAIVGTRRPSPYGVEVAHAIGRGLGAAHVPVVSGLALGIDATAHDGCLAGDGTPIAVLACGPERAYPRRHRALHRRVCESGVAISELPPGAPTFRWAFPARNRIMAALARLTLVVEAADPSGSLITAEFAHDLGRTVGAVPGRITWRMAAGTNALLRDGAVPITSPQDVLDELFGAGMRAAPSQRAAAPKALDAVLEGVESGLSIDEVANRTRLDPAEVRAALGRLESDGLIVRRSLGGWERSAR
jgi:DNA processing protein